MLCSSAVPPGFLCSLSGFDCIPLSSFHQHPLLSCRPVPYGTGSAVLHSANVKETYTLVWFHVTIYLLFFLISFPFILPSLSTVNVSSERALLCTRLPSAGITRFLWYYAWYPTACCPFDFLLFIVVRHTCMITRDNRLSPIDWIVIVKHDWPSAPARATTHSRYRVS